MKFRIKFLFLVVLAGVVSTLLHELGHCIFYWIQGVPAGMSLVMEFPLIDITEKQYGVGSAGGPLVNILLIIVAYLLIRRRQKKSGSWNIYSAIILANSFYLIFRSFLGLAKQDGGEITSTMQLVGLNFFYAAFLFVIIAIIVLAMWIRTFKIKVSFFNLGYYILLFISYLAIILVMEAIDARYLWAQYPSITIGTDRIHNPHP